uniref:Alkylated DNA repair protein AlkB homologue 8 N-terminal domain-containing protein n=1 Tax=Knipowitschia caucasica TaxID=637954 RepID=A0AAV2IZK1_KNICA
MIVDFRKSTVPPPPLSVMDSPITSVESFRFLGTTITQDLKWEPTISSLIKKAQQRMYFLRQLRKAKLPAQMLVQFYTAIIESILTSSITVWFAGATVSIFGESAGAQSVSLHLMMQSSAPLFQQAVLQSLPFSIPLKPRHDAVKLGKSFAQQTNCSVSDLVCLLSLSAEEVLAAQMKTSEAQITLQDSHTVYSDRRVLR